MIEEAKEKEPTIQKVFSFESFYHMNEELYTLKKDTREMQLELAEIK